MARESQEVATRAERGSQFRSSASRYYYAAYQAATAALLYRGATPPIGREAWNHENTPNLLKEHLETLIPFRGKRVDLANRLRQLYKLRIVADYVSSVNINSENLRQAGRDARHLVKIFEKITAGS